MRIAHVLLISALLASHAGAAEPKVSAILKPPEGKEFRCFDFSPDGKYLAVGTDQKTAELWQIAGINQAQILNVPFEYVNYLAFSPDGKILAMGGPGKILLWSIENRKTIEVLEHSPDPDDIIFSLAFNPSGKLLASSGGSLSEVVGYNTKERRCDTHRQFQNSLQRFVFTRQQTDRRMRIHR